MQTFTALRNAEHPSSTFFSVSHSFLSGHVFDTLHFFFKFTSSFAIENRRFFDWSCHIYMPPILKIMIQLQMYD